ncbi:MAG: zinc ribbon domain-containing protein [Kouleothrix sp.]|jgi:predicted amidophosphoribosyltransferase|nr:zinc ribbon domain-containing protein [Kouleothrix sp.]
MKCPTCGAENDTANRFCEQCGSRIDAAPAGQSAQAALAAQPTAAGPTCPSCGAAVLPGEAFCDECGASLSAVAPTAAAPALNDAPTVMAPPVPAASAATDGQHVACPSCGHQNLPDDRFCDNCGAALGQPAPAAAEPAPAPPTPEPAPAPPTQAAPEPAPAAPAPPPPPTQAEAPTVEQPMLNTAVPDAQAAYQAEQQRLNDEIGRQQKIIEQFEQMQSMFGAATPPAVTQGLADARAAKANAEAALAALPPPAPPVDPAEVARLNDEIGRQQKIIEQFEQMQSMFGAATPPAVTQGLADARAAKANAEAALAALSGAPATAAPAAQPSPPEATAPVPPAAEVPVPPTTPTPPVAAPAEPAPPAVPAPPAIAPAAAPVPRLVFDDGKEVALPTDKREIIVGREDPISGIFPEVDLTPHGGETGGVSRQHARITHADGQWSITDLHSTNYTRVDGARLEPDVPTTIQSGVRLQFGRISMVFQV